MIKFQTLLLLSFFLLIIQPIFSIVTADFFDLLTKKFIAQKVYKNWIEDPLSYSRNHYRFGRVQLSKLNDSALAEIQSAISTPQHSIPQRFSKTLHLCSHTGYQTWILLSSMYHPETVTKNLLEHCIQISSKGVSSEIWKKELANSLRSMQFIYSIPEPVVLEKSLSPELVSPLNDLIELWKENQFKNSNFNGYTIHKLKVNTEIFRYFLKDTNLTFYLPLFETIYIGNQFHYEYQKLNDLLEDKLYNPLVSQEEKLNEILELEKYVKSKRYFTFFNLFVGIELWKEDVVKRNQYLLTYFSEVTKNLKSNPNISDKNKLTLKDVLDCFQSLDESKLGEYSLDYYAKFYIDYHSNHHRLIPTKDENSAKLIKYFDSVYFDSYFFEGRLEEMHRECKKIQNK